MAKKSEARSYEEVLSNLRNGGFEISDQSGRVSLRKYSCGAVLERSPEGATRVVTKPGYMFGGEIARLVDKGYQKFFKTSKVEVPATADHLVAVHQFTEELKEAVGGISLYNESLGTVSDRYVYDRVKGRDATERKVRPWEQPVGKA